MTLMGLVENYAGLLACRWFLGLAEAGLFPGTGKLLRAKRLVGANTARCQLLPFMLV